MNSTTITTTLFSIFTCFLPWIMAPVNGTFWLRKLKNHLKTTVSNVSWSPVRSFWRFTLYPFSSAAKSFSLLLTQVDVFFGTPYFAATSLFDNHFSRSLNDWHFPRRVLWTYLRFCAMNIFQLWENYSCSWNNDNNMNSNVHLTHRTVTFETLNKTFEIILNTFHSLISKDQYSKFKVCFHFYPSFL